MKTQVGEAVVLLVLTGDVAGNTQELDCTEVLDAGVDAPHDAADPQGAHEVGCPQG